MSRSKLARSVRVFVRREKARIRRGASDRAEAEKKIQELIFGIRRPHQS